MATGGVRSRSPSPSIAELMMESMADPDLYEAMGAPFGPYGHPNMYRMAGLGWIGDDSDVDEYDWYSDGYTDSEDSEGKPFPLRSDKEEKQTGYDYQFLTEVPGALQCLICTAVARDAQQVDCCGKVFCKVCLRQLRLAKNRACPNCRKKRWKSFSDKKSKC